MKSKKMTLHLSVMKLVTVAFVFIAQLSFSQWKQADSTTSRPWLSVEYGGNWTLADMADRYGYMNHIGLVGGFKTDKNWFFGIETCFQFGNKVRMTGLFDHLIDSYGNITDVDGNIATILVYPRGVSSNIMVGKIIPIFGSNQNSGLFIHGGIGYLLHRMKIETNQQVIPQNRRGTRTCLVIQLQTPILPFDCFGSSIDAPGPKRTKATIDAGLIENRGRR